MGSTTDEIYVIAAGSFELSGGAVRFLDVGGTPLCAIGAGAWQSITREGGDFYERV